MEERPLIQPGSEPDYPVVIAGAGPVGLSLALGLSCRGIRSLVLEKKEALSPHSRALLVTVRTLEILRAWGALDRFLEEGTFLPGVQVWVVGREAPPFTFDFSCLGDATPVRGVVVMPQDVTEALLLEQVRQRGLAEVRFGEEVTGFRQDETGVSSVR